MSCNTLTFARRGQALTYLFTVYDDEGALRPFAAGEYAVLSIGRETAQGSTILSKSTATPSEGSTTVGSAVATFYFVAADTDTTLTGSSYQADIYIGGNADSPIPIQETIQVTIGNRVNDDPPGP